ncbi:proline-rich proteoglycan 2-like [Homalodisca vitripennis]|uniref:proline-rich proteoglycan 2-like n=1 Tax=Homalodisca vitripennis TaxID=197043 RepID=UPI001EEC6691|nr:proline-rich proteoglycan 2-like [Homalodisca vitripennis]KAG8331449.1 hypothetical protein J6590_041057 [Homalodisca vitripennis]
MISEKLILICFAVAMVRSDTTVEISSSVGTTPTPPSNRKPNLEKLKNREAILKNNSISLRFLDSLFGLGIGANLLGIHAGAGIGHGNGGYGDLGQGFVGNPGGGQNPQAMYIPIPPPHIYYVQAPPQYHLPQGIPQGMPQGMSPGMPQGMSPEMPHSQGMSQGMPQGMPQGMSPGMPQGMSPGMSQGIPKVMPHSQGVPQGIPQGIPQEIAQGKPQSQGMHSQREIQRKFGRTPQVKLQRTHRGVPQGMHSPRKPVGIPQGKPQETH